VGVTSLAVRTFELADQERFAQLSGDANPLHLDPLSARRELFGEVLVHGVHATAWLLDAWLAEHPLMGPHRIARLVASFPAPIGLGKEIEARLVSHGAQDFPSAVLEAWGGGQRLARVEVELFAAEQDPVLPGAPASPLLAPRQVALEALAAEEGSLELYLPRALAARALPALSAALTSRALAELLALTRLVGMVCPGARSIFSGLQVRATADGDERRALTYRVTRVVPSFSVVKVAVRGVELEGSLDTFYRPLPEPQPSAVELRARVTAGAFAGQVALVVGGSRGLGEVTAKLVAAGGGVAVVTYHRGAEDAARVVAEIEAAGGRARALLLDVAAPEAALAALEESGLAPTHVYYFASPKIFVKKAPGFQGELFDDFARVYVHGMAAVIFAVRARWSGRLVLFCPSTVAIDERTRDLEEYVAAKSAAEALAGMLAARDPELHVRVERLPRVATDQTVSLIRVPAKSAAEVMLPLLFEMQPGARR
jgi:acyl dehydratase